MRENPDLDDVFLDHKGAGLHAAKPTKQRQPRSTTDRDKVRRFAFRVLALLTAFSRGDNGNVEISLLLDGQIMGGVPFARFGASIPTPGAFTYFQCDVPQGAHDLTVQFRSPNEGFTALISERTLVVIEANQP